MPPDSDHYQQPPAYRRIEKDEEPVPQSSNTTRYARGVYQSKQQPQKLIMAFDEPADKSQDEYPTSSDEKKRYLQSRYNYVAGTNPDHWGYSQQPDEEEGYPAYLADSTWRRHPAEETGYPAGAEIELRELTIKQAEPKEQYRETYFDVQPGSVETD